MWFLNFLFLCVFSTSDNLIKRAAFNMSKAKRDIEDAPGLEKIESLFPPSTPVANNVSMKLPAFWPDAARYGLPRRTLSLRYVV